MEMSVESEMQRELVYKVGKKFFVAPRALLPNATMIYAFQTLPAGTAMPDSALRVSTIQRAHSANSW